MSGLLDILAQLSEAQLNWEEIKECVEADFDEQTEVSLINEDIIQRVIKPTALKLGWKWYGWVKQHYLESSSCYFEYI